MGFFSSLFGGSKSKSESTAVTRLATSGGLNPEKIFPYIVPAGYLEHQSAEPEGLTYPLGHGLHVTVVLDLDGMVRNVSGEELAAIGLTPKQAHECAIENLAAMAERGEVNIQRFTGPRGKPFIIFAGHWLAAACALLPDLCKLAAKNLSTEDFCLCLPQRDAMILFPTADEAFRAEMMAVVRENEADAAKPLSFGLFVLGAEGLREFDRAA